MVSLFVIIWKYQETWHISFPCFFLLDDRDEVGFELVASSFYHLPPLSFILPNPLISTIVFIFLHSLNFLFFCLFFILPGFNNNSLLLFMITFFFSASGCNDFTLFPFFIWYAVDRILNMCYKVFDGIFYIPLVSKCYMHKLVKCILNFFCFLWRCVSVVLIWLLVWSTCLCFSALTGIFPLKL